MVEESQVISRHSTGTCPVFPSRPDGDSQTTYIFFSCLQYCAARIRAEEVCSHFFLSVHTATPSLEDYGQVYIVHTGFAG